MELEDWGWIETNQMIADLEKDHPKSPKLKILKQLKKLEKIHGSVLDILMYVVGLKPFEITYYFEHHGRKCLIIRRNDSLDGFYHNGYVESAEHNRGKTCEDVEEFLEFEPSLSSVGESGELEQYAPLPEDYQGKWYFGFHAFLLSSDGRKYRWYGSFQNVYDLTKKLAEEMDDKNI